MLIPAAILAAAQAPQSVDQTRVDAAIRKGCEWLVARPEKDIKREGESHGRRDPKPWQSQLELVVLTLAHSGFYDPDSPPLKGLIETMLAKELHSTYTVSLQAMALQKIDSKKYLWRIAECAHYLVATQCENGQWDYHADAKCKDFRPPPKTDDQPVIVTDGDEAEPKGPAVKKYGAATRSTVSKAQFPIRCSHRGPPDGDNSNSQYAALGLRAALDSGIEIPKSVLTKARDWLLKEQSKDGGWDYAGSTEVGYGSMTVGGLGSLCIYLHFLGVEYKNNPQALRGFEWIGKHFTLKENPKAREDWQKTAHYYYLYGMERAGILYGTEKFGPHHWYAEGANYLMDAQAKDGDWNGVENTCFAILFLKRGMKPLIKSVDSRKAR